MLLFTFSKEKAYLQIFIHIMSYCDVYCMQEIEPSKCSLYFITKTNVLQFLGQPLLMHESVCPFTMNFSPPVAVVEYLILDFSLNAAYSTEIALIDCQRSNDV